MLTDLNTFLNFYKMGIENPLNTGFSSNITTNGNTFVDTEPTSSTPWYKRLWNYMTGDGQGAQAISKLWDDITGKNTVKLQNQLNEQSAEKEYQRTLQSYSDTMQAYKDAGINADLANAKGAQSTSYNAPNLMAYSGSDRAQFVFNRIAQMANLIPAIYQGEIARQQVDQAQLDTEIKKEDLINSMNQNDDSIQARPLGFFRAAGRGLYGIGTPKGFDFITTSDWKNELGEYNLEAKKLDNEEKRLNIDKKLNDNYFNYGISRVDTSGHLTPHRIVTPNFAQENKIREVDVDYANTMKKMGIAGQVVKMLGNFGLSFANPNLWKSVRGK